jgi:hypothetical protein
MRGFASSLADPVMMPVGAYFDRDAIFSMRTVHTLTDPKYSYDTSKLISFQRAWRVGGL